MNEIRTTTAAVGTAAPVEASGWQSAAAQALAVVAGVVSGLASVLGLCGATRPTSFTTARGGVVDLFGAGLYRFDSLFSGAGNRGTDVVTLGIALPLLVLSVLGVRRGSARWQLVLTGAFAYFLYVSASMAMGAALNSLFLVYVTAFAASLWGLVVAIGAVDRARLAGVVRLLPRRPPAVLMIVSGIVTVVVWVGPVLAAQLAGVAPARLDAYTTLVTVAIDCAVIAPAALASGLLIWRRRPWGYLMAVPLLVLLALLAPLIAAQTISQLLVGVMLTPGQIVGPVSGFMILALAAIATLWSILCKIPADDEGADGPATTDATIGSGGIQDS